MPTMRGLLETALYVADLDRSEHFYSGLFGFTRLVGDERFRALSVEARQVLLLFLHGASTRSSATPGGIIPPHDGHGQLHLAFAIDKDQLQQWEETLLARGVAIESRVTWALGGTSLYFRDPDQHLVELVTPGCWRIY